MKTITIKDKKVTIWNNESSESIPIIYVNVVEGNGESIWNTCQKINCKPFILAAISNLNWNDDMSPWSIPSIFNNDRPCKGLASNYLKLLLNDIIPVVEKELNIKPLYSVLAGYSLGGLFAMWSSYNTDYFTKYICCSSSFWFPNFIEYTKTNNLKENIDSIYFSLGKKESKTTNKYLSTVEQKTTELYNYIRNKKINTIFELNEGNHFKDVNLRIAKGIYWTLNN